MLTRRDFIKFMGLVGSVVLSPLHRLGERLGIEPDAGVGESAGELYAGFVLLPLGSHVPEFVKTVSYPILGELAEKEERDLLENSNRVDPLPFDHIDNLRENLTFPIFIPGLLPDKVTFLQGSILKFSQSGEIWETCIDYGFQDVQEPIIRVSARPIIPRPYPVWSYIAIPQKLEGEFILDEEYIIKYPQKIDFTPQKGLLFESSQGYMLQWIMDDVLYTASMDYVEWRQTASAFGRSLIKI